MAEERKAVAAKLAELEALTKQIEEQKRQLMKAHCRGDQLPVGVVMVWKKDFDKVKRRSGITPELGRYNSIGREAWESLREHQRPKDCLDI